MKYKVDEYDYNLIATKFISNIELSKEIQTNISFVEKYIDDVDNLFSNSIEKEIVYRQLGSIVFSCVEALLKSVIMEIRRRCEKHSCKGNCNYNKYKNDKKLEYASVIELLDYLNKVRLISIIPYEFFKIEELRDLRNYIHIFKGANEDVNKKPFDEMYVEDNLQLYYVLLNQLESNIWFFNKETICLKDMDSDGYVETSDMVEKEKKDFYTVNIYSALIDVMYNYKKSKDNHRFLSFLQDKKKYDMNELAKKVGDALYFSGAYYKSDDDFNEAKNKFYGKIKHYTKNDELIIKIEDEYNKTRKRCNE